VELECWREYRSQAGAAIKTAACAQARLPARDHWPHSDWHPGIDPHDRSLLAKHLVEPAVVVPHEPLLVVILGPTASGKTALSLALAQAFNGEIVNCDSVAMYRDLEIGTAKPSATERTRAPHHLFDCVQPTAYMTAGEYARRARDTVHEISGRARLPIVVGGTGLYLRALLDGLFPGPQRSEMLRDRLRNRSAGRGSEYLHRVLKKVDPAAAATIHPNDTPKLIRAIEVCFASRQKMSDLWKQGRDPLRGFQILRLGLNPSRAILYERINDRAARMFTQGLVEETAMLVEKYGDSIRALASLGYKQALDLLAGELTRDQAIAAAQQAHRNYAKRQMTWFRREPHVVWLGGFGDEVEVQRSALQQVNRALATASERA
jgi:tRNA dimethylallyltransferase